MSKVKFKNGDLVQWEDPRYGIREGKLIDYDKGALAYCIEYEKIIATTGNTASVQVDYTWQPQENITKVKKKRSPPLRQATG
jgi:hypothetical protein